MAGYPGRLHIMTDYYLRVPVRNTQLRHSKLDYHKFYPKLFSY